MRFPSKDGLDGSDAMNPGPVYCAASVMFETDGAHQGYPHPNVKIKHRPVGTLLSH